MFFFYKQKKAKRFTSQLTIAVQVQVVSEVSIFNLIN